MSCLGRPGFGGDEASGETGSARVHQRDEGGGDGDDDCEEGSPVS